MAKEKTTYTCVTESELDTLLSYYMEDMLDLIGQAGAATNKLERRERLRNLTDRYNEIYDVWAKLKKEPS